MTVHTLPLRHSVPVVGFIFREKQKLQNIRKDKITQYNLGIKEIRSIKEGNDLVRPDGTFITKPGTDLSSRKAPIICILHGYFLFSQRLPKSLKDIDLLYFEATFMHEDKKLARITNHSTSVQAATLAKKAGVGKLLMGHFSNRYKSLDTAFDRRHRKYFP